jgi:hypothetical protein
MLDNSKAAGFKNSNPQLLSMTMSVQYRGPSGKLIRQGLEHPQVPIRVYTIGLICPTLIASVLVLVFDAASCAYFAREPFATSRQAPRLKFPARQWDGNGVPTRQCTREYASAHRIGMTTGLSLACQILPAVSFIKAESSRHSQLGVPGGALERHLKMDA